MRPLLVAVLLIAVGGAVWLVQRRHDARHVTLAFERATAPVPPLELTFFPSQLAFASPSPPPPLGRRSLTGEASVAIAADLVPGHAVVRYRGQGIGTGYAHLQLGRSLPPIQLRPATTLVGRIGEPVAFWCFGWRCAGLLPVAGAEVVVMGGGEHGIDLGGAVTDADGRFVVEGVDGSLDGLGLRVRARGFVLAHEQLGRFADQPDAYPVVALAPAQIRSGRVVAPPAVDATQLRLLARGLPGVQAVPTADGTFVLDHVPVGMEPRLVVSGLPDTWTWLPARATANSAIRVEIVPGASVRGRVVDAATRKPLAGALVWCGDQDAVRADAEGSYELPRQLPGDVEIEAKWEFVDSRRRRQAWSGRTRILLEPGRRHDDVDVVVTAL